MRAGVRCSSLFPTSFLAISNQETAILSVVDSPFCFRMIHLELTWIILCWSTFGLHTAWQGTAGQEGPKWQGTTSTKLCNLLKLRAARVGWDPRIDRVCQTRFCGTSLCSTRHEPTSGVRSCRWWGTVYIRPNYVCCSYMFVINLSSFFWNFQIPCSSRNSEKMS